VSVMNHTIDQFLASQSAERTYSFKSAFRLKHQRWAINEKEQSVIATSKEDQINPQSTGVKQASENFPSCPYCNARMDDEGNSFASRIVIGEAVYYCNNPICAGGHPSLRIMRDSTTQESGTAMQ